VGAAPVTMRLAGRDVSAFRAWGWSGFAVATAVALGFCSARGLSLATEVVLIGVAVATFLAVALVTKIATGHETLTYYHHEIAVLAMVGLVAAAADAPVLGHLDATALGIGAFLCFGRIGCLFVGCCHGRAAANGITYGERHVRAGFPEYLVGVRLLPVQAIESGIVAALVIAGIAVSSGPPGAAFGLYVTAYALVRFGLEELRGDTARRYWRRLSEAQWSSLLVVTGVTVASAAGALPGFWEHLAALALLVLSVPFVIRRRRGDLLGPAHLREVAAALPEPRRGRARVIETSLGLRLSGGLADGTTHYTLSRRAGRFGAADAEQLAGFILWRRHPDSSASVVPGAAGAFHVIVE
jgi:hypothetical protein